MNKLEILKSGFWVIAGFSTQKLIQLASNLILTRLLFPSDFGLMALVNTIILGLGMFSDMGVRQAIIKHSGSLNDEFINTAWTIQVFRGVWVFLLACLLSYPASIIYDNPNLFYLICFVGINCVVNGFQNSEVTLYGREVKTKKTVLVKILAQISGVMISIVLAYIYKNVWSIAIGSFCASLIELIVSYKVFPKRVHRITFDKRSYIDIFHYSKWIFFSTLLTFVGGQGVLLIQGLLVNADQLGMLSLAGLLAWPIGDLVSRILDQVLMPHLARVNRNSKEILLDQYLVYKAGILLFSIPVFITISIFSDAIVDLLYHDNYKNVGQYLRLIAFNQSLLIPIMCYGQYLMAVGNSKQYFSINLTNAVLRTVFLLIGFYVGQVTGMIMGLGVANLVILMFVSVKSILLTRKWLFEAAQMTVILLFCINTWSLK